jgi:hypothetical protein
VLTEAPSQPGLFNPITLLFFPIFADANDRNVAFPRFSRIDSTLSADRTQQMWTKAPDDSSTIAQGAWFAEK